jgi:hypothetical protein
MVDVSEAEVDAAAWEIEESFNDVTSESAKSIARRALTAAAQVRAQAAQRHPGFDYIVNCAKPNCDGVHGVEKLVDAPHGVMAYDCSCHMALINSPDEPAALGMRKGE